MPKTPQDLFHRLDDLGISVTTVEHPPLYTVEQSQQLRGDIAGAHTKNLFLKDRKGNLFLVVVGEEAQVDLKRIHTRIGGAGRVSFGKPDLLMETLGVVPGAVTVFGLINDGTHRVTVVLDADLMRAEQINGHPLTNAATTTIGRDDLLTFIRSCGHEPAILAVAETDAEAPAAD